MPSELCRESTRTKDPLRLRPGFTRKKVQRDLAQRDQAWIGDAVLALYARLKILREDGTLDGAKAVRMSSNQFLSVFGEPTAVEAGIGRAFEQGGLDAAFGYIESAFIALFTKQEEKRLRRAGKAPRGGPTASPLKRNSGLTGSHSDPN
jgi:hypothetical protein